VAASIIARPRLTIVGSVQYGLELIPAGTDCPFTQIILGRGRGNLLGDGYDDELFDADSLLPRHLVDMAMDGSGQFQIETNHDAVHPDSIEG